jgi:hypothetical protein
VNKTKWPRQKNAEARRHHAEQHFGQKIKQRVEQEHHREKNKDEPQ